MCKGKCQALCDRPTCGSTQQDQDISKIRALLDESRTRNVLIHDHAEEIAQLLGELEAYRQERRGKPVAFVSSTVAPASA